MAYVKNVHTGEIAVMSGEKTYVPTTARSPQS